MARNNPARGRIQWTRGELWVRRCVVGFIIALGLLAIWFSYADESERKVLAAGSDVRVPIGDLKAGKLRLFPYAIDLSTTTQIAAQRGEDGVVRIAFGSCRNCRKFRHYKWFGKLVCGHCNHTIKLPKPGDKPAEKSGCASVALPYDAEGGQLVIRGQVIAEEFRRWFQPGPAMR